jgi:Tannase and feruloyl esterase
MQACGAARNARTLQSGGLMKIACCAALIVAFGFVSAPGAATCESIASLDLPNTEVTLAAQIATGAFTAPDQEANDRGICAALPAFCRVTATLTPSPDSDIRVEVWLPAAGWNGKYRAVGNGAWRGSISYGAMANALRRGYATSSTDTGHVGRQGNPAPADGFATFLSAMRARGLTDEEIVTMSRVNAVPADRACGRIALLKQE